MTLRTELRDEMREAAAGVLAPAVREITRAAAAEAVARAPRTVDKVAPFVVAGGTAAVMAVVTAARKARARRATPAARRRRRVLVQDEVEVAVDAGTAYDRFAGSWPGVRRPSEAEVVAEAPADRLVWRGTGAEETLGIATFHRLGTNLTRVQISVRSRPRRFSASATRLSRRALRTDLMRFRAELPAR